MPEPGKTEEKPQKAKGKPAKGNVVLMDEMGVYVHKYNIHQNLQKLLEKVLKESPIDPVEYLCDELQENPIDWTATDEPVAVVEEA
jgi:hypothetical protein